MNKLEVSFPQLAFVAVTRGLGGAGLALLVSPHLKPETRRTVGWTLLGLGILSTIPIATRIVRVMHENETVH